MAKEFYDVSYKTYFNDRIKPVVFQGKGSHPLYVQVTYDRKTSFFKSYYFDVFARPKYDFLRTTISQIDELESRVIDFIIAWDPQRFGLDDLSRRYKWFSPDLLDSFEGLFKIWLGGTLKKEGFPGLGVLMEHATEKVSAIQLWDDLKKTLDSGIFNRIEEMAVRHGPPYLPLAAYIRHKQPEGPFCLPLHEWLIEAKRLEIEDFLDVTFWKADMGEIIRVVKRLLYPTGFW